MLALHTDNVLELGLLPSDDLDDYGMILIILYQSIRLCPYVEQSLGTPYHYKYRAA